MPPWLKSSFLSQSKRGPPAKFTAIPTVSMPAHGWEAKELAGCKPLTLPSFVLASSALFSLQSVGWMMPRER